MPAQTSGLGAAPAVDRSVSIEMEDAALAKIGLDGDELQGSGLPRIVGNSTALRRMLGIAGVVAPTDATVLINGETGTGSSYSLAFPALRAPLVSVSYAAIPRDLIASELFGHEKGAFTGATRRRFGRFELAIKYLRMADVLLSLVSRDGTTQSLQRRSRCNRREEQ
jgi:transcriptional regulator with GAF, ATPase, and Fis domain